MAFETELDRHRVMELIRSNTSWMNHPAIKGNRYYFLDWEKWIVYAPYVIDQQLEEIERLLCK